MEEESEQPAGESNSQQPHQLKATLLTSPEGRLLLLGATLALIYTFWLGIKLLLSPEESQLLIGMTATGLLFGRAFAMAFGYSQGLGHRTIIPICIIIETILVLIFYPLFVFSWRRLLVINRLKNVFERIQKSAETHKDKVQKYGVIGLFFFVWFPFWMTGPVVGSAIGYLLGFPAWLTMSVVLTGTYIAMGAWAYLMFDLHSRAAVLGSWAPALIIGLLITFILAGHWLNRRGKGQQQPGGNNTRNKENKQLRDDEQGDGDQEESSPRV